MTRGEEKLVEKRRGEERRRGESEVDGKKMFGAVQFRVMLICLSFIFSVVVSGLNNLLLK